MAMTPDSVLPFPARRREWPYAGLDLGPSAARGWEPTPFREFVLKVHSRCNLACDYCYVYEMDDETWRAQPLTMAPATIAATAWRIAEHARTHHLANVRVVLHGGEPLLAGRRRVAEVVSVLRDMVRPATVDVSVQTNGVLLTEEMLDMLLHLDVRVGVSVDGTAIDHDRHRRHASGRGSHGEVAAALDRLRSPRYRHLYAGLLCTIDVGNDPLATYAALVAEAPPRIDFLLPHGNWTSPPPGRDPRSAATPYADWLTAIFDHWYATSGGGVGVRLFEEVITLVLGGHSRSEAVGLSPAAMIVVDTNGAIEQVDALRSVHHGAAATELTVFADSFDTALAHPAVIARQIGVDALSETCRRCDVHHVCGAGFYPHRYAQGDGYRNPSVYCPDLLRLVRHIGERVRRDLASLAVSRDG